MARTKATARKLIMLPKEVPKTKVKRTPPRLRVRIQPRSQVNKSQRRQRECTRAIRILPRVPTSPGLIRRRKIRPGAIVLRTIKHLQNRMEAIIPFRRVKTMVKSMMPQLDGKQRHFRFQATALEAIRTGVEDYLMSYLSMGNIAALHCRRITLMTKDLNLVFRIQKRRTLWHASRKNRSNRRSK